jgi:hypothetical protein
MCNCNHSTPAKRAREIRAYTAYLDAIEAGDRSFITEPESLDPADLALEITAEIEIVEDYLRQLSDEISIRISSYSL